MIQYLATNVFYPVIIQSYHVVNISYSLMIRSQSLAIDMSRAYWCVCAYTFTFHEACAGGHAYLRVFVYYNVLLKERFEQILKEKLLLYSPFTVLT